MANVNRRLLLATRPSGMVDGATIRMSDGPVPEPADGEALVRVRYLSIDPTIRTWMDDAPGYLPPIGIGEVIRGAGIGEVVASNSTNHSVGDLVFGMLGWQDFAIAGGAEPGLQVIPAGGGPSFALHRFCVTGIAGVFSPL